VLLRSIESGQYTSVRFTERLAEIGALASIGSIGDSYDNSLAESVNGLYNTELIRRQGPWRNAEHVELATLTYIDWLNRRLHSELSDVPPTEFEHNYYARTRTRHQAPTPTRT
jgi:putative transposase